VVPLVTTELYPFSRAPMFADAPTHYCDYAVITPDGERLSDAATLTRLGLQRNYWGNPLGVGVGFRPAESADVFGETATGEQVRAMVAERLRQFPQWDYVDVEQRVVGPTDGDHVGVTHTERWRIIREDRTP
jgi:hypothetical protein